MHFPTQRVNIDKRSAYGTPSLNSVPTGKYGKASYTLFSAGHSCNF